MPQACAPAGQMPMLMSKVGNRQGIERVLRGCHRQPFVHCRHVDSDVALEDGIAPRRGVRQTGGDHRAQAAEVYPTPTVRSPMESRSSLNCLPSRAISTASQIGDRSMMSLIMWVEMLPRRAAPQAVNHHFRDATFFGNHTDGAAIGRDFQSAARAELGVMMSGSEPMRWGGSSTLRRAILRVFYLPAKEVVCWIAAERVIPGVAHPLAIGRGAMGRRPRQRGVPSLRLGACRRRSSPK